MDTDGLKTAWSNKRPRSVLEVDDVNPSNGRKAAEARNEDSSSSEDDMGPVLPTSVPKKKRRKLPYEKLYISSLPSSARYSKSLMHKDQLSFVTFTPFTDFLITSSVDGVVKFWKKVAIGIEFVKEFRAHVGEIRSVTASSDGRSFATAGADRSIKLFDVVTFGRSGHNNVEEPES
ncbi:MAG: hypothetical protein M1830_004422 [Pleopsidium flavum]|nr:MAG: hypothetical protein M1830_004422 [Pleopsidium flavum]